MADVEKNRLYYGDNLDVLRRYVADDSVDLVYLDPPFNSNASYNVLFEEQNGTQAAAQIQAFEDTWQWDERPAAAYDEAWRRAVKSRRPCRPFGRSSATRDMLAYLAMMAPRLVELRRVLKPTGSIYLHCDPTASHYLKMLMDAVFGPRNSGTRSSGSGTAATTTAKRLAQVSDTLLFYAGQEFTWNPSYAWRHDPSTSRVTTDVTTNADAIISH